MANMIAIAAGIAIGLGEGEAFVPLIVLGGLPAVIAGSVLGVVARRTGDWSIGSRYAVIGIPALGVVVFFGCIAIPLAYFIPFALVPTAMAVRIIELRTRAARSLPVPTELEAPAELCATAKAADPVVLGMLLGLATTIVVAIGMNGATIGGRFGVHHHGSEVCYHPHPVNLYSPGAAVFILGLLPAVITGALLGRFAHRCRAWPIWARWLVLIPPPLSVVVALGGISGLYEYVLPSLIPTLAAALWLERRTRDGSLPAARTL